MELGDTVQAILKKTCCQLSEDFNEIKRALKKDYESWILNALPDQVTDLKQRNELLQASRDATYMILSGESSHDCCDHNRLRRVARKLEELLDDYMLQNHHEFLNEALKEGHLKPNPESKSIPVTPKFRKLIQAVLDNNYYFMQSYYHRSLASVMENLGNSNGRKAQELSRKLKTKIFEANGFSEKMIEYYLDKETISFEELRDLDEYARKAGTSLVPRDIGRARKNIVKARTSILRRAGGLTPRKKENLQRLLQAGFSYEHARKIAEKARLSSVEKILKAYAQARTLADRNVHYFRVGSGSPDFQKSIQSEFVKHLNGTHYYLFVRNRLCSILKDLSSREVRRELKQLYRKRIESDRFLKRLTTLRTLFKVKLFQYDGAWRRNGVPISTVTRMNQEEYEIKVTEVLDHLSQLYKLRLKRDAVTKKQFAKQVEDDPLASVFTSGQLDEDLVLRLVYILDQGLKPDQAMVEDGWFDHGVNLRAKVHGRRADLEKRITSFVARYFRRQTYRDRFKRNPLKMVDFIANQFKGRSRLEKGFFLQQIYLGLSNDAPEQQIFYKVVENLSRLEPTMTGSQRSDAFLQIIHELPAIESRARDFFFKQSRYRVLLEVAQKCNESTQGRRRAS